MKQITVDWDSLPEVSRLLNQAKARYFELKRAADGQPTRKERARLTFDSCTSIWSTDVTTIYGGMALDTARRYYVYAHLDTSKKIAPGVNGISTFAATLGMPFAPFYVGKGTGMRKFDSDRSETYRKVKQKLELMGKSVEVFTVKDNLTEAEALQYEAKLIDIFGLIPNGGTLANLDEGHRAEERRELYKDYLLRLRTINRELYG